MPHSAHADMIASTQPNSIRTSPLCIALATAAATVGVGTALFFATWRLVIDAHQYFFGTPMSSLGAWALVYIMLLVVLPISIIILAACIDRCPPPWLGFSTFFFALVATPCFIACPMLRPLLLVSLLAEGTNSSERWYWGALLQLVIAFCLLRYFRRPRISSR